MEIALGTYYSTNSMALALSILRFPEDYGKRPMVRTKALRYIYSHRRKYGLTAPDLEAVSQIGLNMFDEFKQTNNLEGMREVADIMTEFAQGNNLLDRIRDIDVDARRTATISSKSSRTVYSDSQNVHNSKINQSVIKCLEHLFSKYQHLIVLQEIDMKPTNNRQKFEHKVNILTDVRGIIVAKYKDKKDIINSSIDYIRTSTAIFGEMELGMIDAFLALWFWIQDHKYKDELENRLLEELKEMHGLCTTGHIARLMNVMQGFTEDENLSIRISNRDQCFAVVKQYLTKELQECDDEDVLFQMTEGGEKYVKFIRKSVAKKLLSWQQEYGREMLHDIADIVNDFAKTVVFETESKPTQ